jgi:hypothetical protein
MAPIGAGSVTTYDYTDATGDPLFQVVRYEPKDFRQRHSDGNGGWIWNMKGVQRVIYRLPDVTAAVADGHTVFVVEGEKAADALTKLGVTATCSPGGAGKWRNEYAAHFKGADVVVLPDNDPQATLPDGTPKRHPDGRPVLPGQDHAADVAESLRNIAASVRVLMLPDLPTKGDVADGLLPAAHARPSNLWRRRLTVQAQRPNRRSRQTLTTMTIPNRPRSTASPHCPTCS